MTRQTAPTHAPLDDLLTRIARASFTTVETLETRNADGLDFHDVAVWEIRAALQAAYDAGRREALTPETAPEPEPGTPPELDHTVAVTRKERLLLRNIAENLMTPLNGAAPGTPQDTVCWVDEIVSSGPVPLAPRSVPGVMTSLVKKGLVHTDGATCRLTEAGLAAYRANAAFDAMLRTTPPHATAAKEA